MFNYSDRINEIKDNKYYLEEYDIITTKTSRGVAYYKHIIDNIDINRSNPNNSYIMWACNKVDILDKDKPCKIVPARTSLPDIDTDFPPFFREAVISYIREKYGEENVAQIATFGSIKGKSAIKEAANITELCDFETANSITKCLPEEAKIIDFMNEQNEDSIIMYTLKNLPTMLEEYAKLENGEIVGEYAELIKIAIELEGSIKSIGQHAAGVVVSSNKISEICPIIKAGDKYVAGFDKKDIEYFLVKFDILGVSALEKMMGINELLRYGKFVDDKIEHYR